MFVLVCYDISEDRRRLRVGSELENFGCRVQYSVFECHLEEPQLRKLQARLLTLIDDQETMCAITRFVPKTRPRCSWTDWAGRRRTGIIAWFESASRCQRPKASN